MNNREISKSLQRAVSDVMPDVKDRIMAVDVEEDDSIREFKAVDVPGRRTHAVMLRYASCFAAVLLVFMVGAKFLLMPRVDYIVSIDVNPSIELSVDKRDIVIECRAMNDDAVDILDGMDLRKTDIKVATNAILGSMVKNGYFNGAADNAILISVVDAEPEKAVQIKNELSGAVKDALKDSQSAAMFMYQSDEISDDMKEFAHHNKISVGKADFILKLAAKDSSLDPKKLAAMSVKHLAELVKEKGIDINDIVTEYDDDVDDAIEDTIEDINKKNGYNYDDDDDEHDYEKHDDDDDDEHDYEKHDDDDDDEHDYEKHDDDDDDERDYEKHDDDDDEHDYEKYDDDDDDDDDDDEHEYEDDDDDDDDD